MDETEGFVDSGGDCGADPRGLVGDGDGKHAAPSFTSTTDGDCNGDATSSSIGSACCSSNVGGSSGVLT